METSLRFGGDSKCLRIHAKEKFPMSSSNSICQINGELDTKSGTPTYVNAMIRYFHPELSASLGVGVQYSRHNKPNNKVHDKVHYNIRGKKAFPVTADESVTFNVKGRCNIDEEFKKIDYTGATELVWKIEEVKKDQDLRLKLGYDVVDKIAYLQIRENNWTFNIDGDRRWNVRYDL